MIRQPIITVLGHVDHGKTTLLDYIRGSTVAAREAGAITQHVGATQVPIDHIQEVCSDLLTKMGKLSIPGLLFIDTPGHEVFTNLRKRGGSIADLAILVIDINQGIQPQTREAVEILKHFKVPFVVAATKVDVLPGWKSQTKMCADNVKNQIASTKEFFEKKLYALIGQVSELGYNCNLWTNISDYRKEVAVIPVSAKTGEGIAELLALLAGLAQKFLSNRLNIDEKANGRGTILEIKEEKGMGTTADVIIYDGRVTSKDYLLIGGTDGVIETSVKALLEPLPLSEIREKNTRFKRIESVNAAAGIKILAPEMDKAIAGAQIVCSRTKKGLEGIKEDLLAEIQRLIIETEQSGIILKCDTLGSLEAVTGMLKARGIPIKSAGIGEISRKDVVQAKSVLDSGDALNAFVLGFNVKSSESIDSLAKDCRVPVIVDSVVYKLVERFEEAIELKKKELELEKLKGLTWPVKFRILPGYVFRQNNPAIVGVEVITGKLKSHVGVMNSEGKKVGEVKAVEKDGKKVDAAESGDQVAVSISGLTIGRQANEGDELYSDVTEEDFRTLKQKKDVLNKAEVAVLKYIAEIHRKNNDLWGI